MSHSTDIGNNVFNEKEIYLVISKYDALGLLILLHIVHVIFFKVVWINHQFFQEYNFHRNFCLNVSHVRRNWEDDLADRQLTKST